MSLEEPTVHLIWPFSIQEDHESWDEAWEGLLPQHISGLPATKHLVRNHEGWRQPEPPHWACGWRLRPCFITHMIRSTQLSGSVIGVQYLRLVALGIEKLPCDYYATCCTAAPDFHISIYENTLNVPQDGQSDSRGLVCLKYVKNMLK